VTLPGSVPSPSELQATFAATLFDEWVRAGLRDVVVSPGSRSTPLVLAASSREELALHVRLDERSAGFFALGRSLVTSRPVVVVVTSGTAAAELHACVAEADLAAVPLIVVTADRPPELRGVGAPQTIDQRRLYGPMVRRFEDPGVARLEATSTWRPLAARLWRTAAGEGATPGPVHLNAAFVEPLVAAAAPLPEGRAGGRPWRRTSAPVIEAASLEVAGRAVLCVVGAGVGPDVIEECVALGWVVVGDATARGALAHADALLRTDDLAERLRPELVVRLGGLPASKMLGERLRSWGAPVVALSGAGFVADPDGVVGETLAGLPRRDAPSLAGDLDYAKRWCAASGAVEEWLVTLETPEAALSEPLVARAVVHAANGAGVALVVGSSMPVRDVEWWAPTRTAPVFANRGVNGIDGVVSTALGVAAGARALALVGDLTMLHDVSALVEGLGDAGGTCVLVVADNRGGGIFSFLSQATALDGVGFERLFGTPRLHDLEAVAGAFGHGSTTVATLDELRAALDKGLATDGLSVVVARVPTRARNVEEHATLNDGARARALEVLA
jgi:2-succinyl-5-enolpyruvyl-6-hydroxy-3-cyclohexene-1-carboxylate synthase